MSTADRDAVIEALRGGDRFVVTSHVNPDGDALGSLLAMHLVLVALGKDSVMVVGGTTELPGEFGFLDLPGHGLLRSAPADTESRTLVCVDCADATRVVATDLVDRAAASVNIDHHKTNSRYADVNFVVEAASSTAEVVADLAEALGIALDPDIAQAVYVGLVTDTGRFQYTNTSPKALRLAAELREAGANAEVVFNHVYESMPLATLRLLGHALLKAETREAGRVVVTVLSQADFAAAGADEQHSDGIIEELRTLESAELALFIRELPQPRGGGYKGSLRSAVDAVDVSAIAASLGGGGHERAAGFSSDLSPDEITDRVIEAYRAARATD